MDTRNSNLDDTTVRPVGPERRPIDPVSFALAEALQAHRDGSADDELRAILRGLCANAHRDHLRAEQLLVVVKKAWSELSGLTTLKPQAARVDALARVVRLLVEEYYDRPLTADA